MYRAQIYVLCKELKGKWELDLGLLLLLELTIGAKESFCPTSSSTSKRTTAILLGRKH